MVYSYAWHVYRAMWDEEVRGYIYAHNETEAQQAWKKIDAPAANALVEVEDVEFYVTSPAEGGYILFLSPDELVDHFIDHEDADKPHVFYIEGEHE